MSSGGFRGRGFGPRGHHHQGPNGPGCQNARGRGARSEGASPRPSAPVGPRPVGPSSRLPDGPNSRGSNFRGGTGPSHGTRPNFNSPRRPPRHPSRPSDNWSPRGGSPHFSPWRGGRPPRFNGPPRPPFFRGRGQPNNFANCSNYRYPFMAGNMQGMVLDVPPPPETKPATPHLGSEEERVRKITEAADELKRKLSAVPNEPDVWCNDAEDDASMDFSSDADYASSISSRGIPELKHDPPELNLTLNDLRDIGRVDHDHGSKQARDVPDNASNSSLEDSDPGEVTILDYNPVQTMIEIDLWSDDNYMEFEDGVADSRTTERSGTATATISTPSDAFQDSSQDRAENFDTFSSTNSIGDENISQAPVPSEDSRDFGKNDVVEEESTPEGENERRPHRDNRTLEEEPDTSGVQTKKRFYALDEKIQDTIIDVDAISNSNSRIEKITREADKNTSLEKNVNCIDSDKLETPRESKESSRETVRIDENNDQASEFDEDKDETSRKENFEDAQRGAIDSIENKRITGSREESTLMKKIVSQVDRIDNTMEINESMLNGKEKPRESSVVDATLTNDSQSASEAREKSEPAIVAKKTKASVKQMRIEIGEDSTIDVSSLEARQKATVESRFVNRSSLSCDNEKSKAHEQQSNAITKNAHSASISEDRRERKEKNITNESRKEERKREESRREGRESDTRKRLEEPAESSGRSRSKSDSNGKTEARDKTEQPTRIDSTLDDIIDDNHKKIVDKLASDGGTLSSEKKIDEQKLPISDSKKICERRKLVRRMPDVKAFPRNRKSAVGECTAVNFDKSERPVVFDPRGPPPTMIPYANQSIRTSETTCQETGINSQIPPAFDPRLSSRERSALLTSAPLAPSSIPIAQDPFAIGQAYPACQIANFVPTSMNYGAPPPTIIGAPIEPPICLQDPYAPLLPLATMSATIPLPAKPRILLQPPPPPPPVTKPSLDMVDELEDMHEAMEFAKTFMSMNDDVDDSTDSDFFHMPTFPDLPPIELPPLPPPDVPPSSAIPPPLELPPAPPNGSEKLVCPARRSVTNNVCREDRQPVKVEPSIKQEPIDRSVDVVEEEPPLLSDDCVRPKVVFNLATKNARLSKPESWQQQDQSRSKPTAQPTSSPVVSIARDRTRSVNGHDDRDKSRFDQRVSRHNGVVDSSPIDRPEPATKSHCRSRSPSPSRKINENSLSTPDQERNEPSSRRRDSQDATTKKSTDTGTPESTWKSRVIGRFLKMSKNDIRNMLNNTSLRKFDIAMKHLVKERRSSLSLGVRNTEDERTRVTGASYNREEFMDQLSAMLDPSATVDFCNLPTQFIHHLSEVLQLDSTTDFESALKSTAEPTDSKSSPSAGQRAAPPPLRRVPRATPPSGDVKEIDDRGPSRGRENKSMSTTSVAGAASPSVTRRPSSRAHDDDTVDSRCANAAEIAAEVTNTNRGARSAGRGRRGRPSVVQSRSPMTSNNGIPARNPDRDTTSMTDLDDIFSPGIARERKKLSSVVVGSSSTTRCDKRSIDSTCSSFVGYNEVAGDPCVDRVERAAVELDKIFTAGIARFKLPSIKAARPADANEGDDDDDDGSWHRDERKSNDEAARSRQRSVCRVGSRPDKWTRRKPYEDRDSFRNLTKEEWEAKYGGESSYVSYEQEYRAMVATRARRSEHEAVQESEGATGVRSRLGDEVHPEGGVNETWSDSDEASRYRNADEPVGYGINAGHNRVSGDSSSSSSVSGSSSSSDDEHEAAAPSVTKLLKVIKAKEKIAKKRSINEEIRDEVTAEIEKKRRERGRVHKSRHKSRLKKSSHRRRKDRKEKVKERKKRGRKRRKKRSRRSGSESRESSEEDDEEEESDEGGASSSSRGRRASRLLTESEIKKEIIVKDEPETESITPAHVQPRSKSSLAIRLNDESRPPSTSSASSLPAMAISANQPKTKAQLKQMPAAVRKAASAIVVSKETSKIDGLPVSEAKEVVGKVVAVTAEVVEASPTIAEPVKSTMSSTEVGSTGQIQPGTSVGDEVQPSLKTNSKKLDIKTYKERARQRQIRETEKLRQINENPSTLTQDLLNISIDRKNVVDSMEAADGPTVATTISDSAVVPTTASTLTVVSRKTSSPAVVAASSARKTIDTSGSPRNIVSTSSSPGKSISTSTSSGTSISTSTSSGTSISTSTSSGSSISTSTSSGKPISTSPSPGKSITTSSSHGKSISTSPSPGKSISTSPSPGTLISTATSHGKPISTSPSPGKPISTSTSSGTPISTSMSSGTSISTSTSHGKPISTSASPGKSISTSPSPGKSISTSPSPGKSTSTSPSPGKSISTSPSHGKPISTSASPGKPISTSPSPGKPISTSSSPGKSDSTVETTKVSIPDGSGSQSLPSKSAPPKKLIRRRSITTAPKVDTESTSIEARAEAGKFAHIKSEGSKEMKLREKLKKTRPRGSLEGLESTIPTGKPARVRKRGSTSSGTATDDGGTVSSDKDKEDEKNKEEKDIKNKEEKEKEEKHTDEKHKEEQATVAAEKNKEHATVPSERDEEKQTRVASDKLANEQSTASAEKQTDEQTTAPSEKLTIQQTSVTTEKRTEEQTTVSSKNCTEERSTVPSESLAIERPNVASEKRTEEQSTVYPKERSEEQPTVSLEKDTEEQTIASEQLVTEQSTTPSEIQPEFHAVSASNQPIEEPATLSSTAVIEKNDITNQSKSEKSEVSRSENPAEESTTISSKERTKEFSELDAEEKSEALETPRPKPNYPDLFKKDPKSEALETPHPKSNYPDLFKKDPKSEALKTPLPKPNYLDLFRKDPKSEALETPHPKSNYPDLFRKDPKSEALETPRPKPNYLDLFRKGPKSDSLPDTVPLESIPTVHIPEKLDEPLDEQSDLNSLPMPMTDLPGWSITPNVGNELNDSSEDPPFRGFSRDTIVLHDKVLTDTEGNISDIDDLGRVPLDFEDGDRTVGVLDLDDVTSTGVSLDAPLSYGDDEFVEDGVVIETSLLGFPVENEMTDEPVDNDLVTHEFDKSAGKSLNEESSHESAETISRVTPSLNDSPAPDDFLIGDVQRQESVPSTLLVDELPTEPTGLSSKDNVEKPANENTPEFRIDDVEVGTSRQFDNTVESRIDAAQIRTSREYDNTVESRIGAADVENKETIAESPDETQQPERTDTPNSGALTCDNEILTGTEFKVERESYLDEEKSIGLTESQESQLDKPEPEEDPKNLKNLKNLKKPEEVVEESIVESKDCSTSESAQIDPAIESVSRKTPSSEDVKEEIKEVSADKPRTVEDNRHVEATRSVGSHRGGAKSKDHGRPRGKSTRHRNHPPKIDKKTILTEKMVEEAVTANIVKVVPKPSSKESVLARMIEIDVEIHKLMNEKMTLYTMLQSGEFPAKDSVDEATSDRNNDDASTVADKEDSTITDIAPPTVLASHLVRNFDKTVLMTPSIVQEQKKISSDVNGRTKKRKRSPQPRNQAKDVEVETRRERNISESKSISRGTTSEESSRQESSSTRSREKSTSSTELEDGPENRRRRKTKLKDSNRQTARRAREDSSKEDPREASLESVDRSAKSTRRDLSPKLEKTKRKTKPSADSKKMDETSRVRKPMEEKSGSIARPSDKIGSVIYSDESTWDSLEAIQSDEQRSKKENATGSCTGLALLEESFKREIAQTRKLKAVERRKNKKTELRRVILEPTALTADDEETPLSDLYERKNHQKRDNRAAKTRGKSVGSSNEDPVRVWKHITTVIDAVASDRVEQLYTGERSPNSRDSTPPTAFRRGDNEIERERSPSITPPESTVSEPADQSKISKIDDSGIVQRRDNDFRDSDRVEPDETSKVSKKSKEIDENHPSESRESETGDTTSTSGRSSSADDSNKRSREEDTSSGLSTPGVSDNDIVAERNTTPRPAVDTTVAENEKEVPSTSVAESSKKSSSGSNRDREDETKAASLSAAKEPSSTASSTMKSVETKDVKVEAKDKVKAETKEKLKNESKEKLKDETKEKLKNETKEKLRNETKEKPKNETKEKLKNETKEKLKDESKEKLKNDSKEKPKDDKPRAKPESTTHQPALEKSTKEKNRRSSKDREHGRSRSHSRGERERERKTSSRADDGHDRERSGRPKSATKRKQRDKSNPPNRRNSRHSEDRSKRSRSKKRDRERSDSRGRSPHGSEPSRKRPHRSHRSSSPKSHSTSADDQARRRGRKRKRRAEMTREQMMNCKVQLIDCKYTYLSPEMHPRVLKKFGISRINPYVAPTLVAESSSPPEMARAETPSPPTLTKVETPGESVVEESTEQPSSPGRDVEVHEKEEDRTERDDQVVVDEAEDEDGVDETIQIVKVVEDMQNPTMSDQDEEGETSAPEIIDETSCPGDAAPQDVIAVEDETNDELELKNNANDEVEVLEEKRTSTKSADKPHDKPNDKSQRSPESELEDDIDYETRTRYTVHKGPILDIKVLDDSFLAASEDGAIYRYSQTSNSILNIYKGHAAAVTCIYVLEMPAKRWNLYSGSLDGTFRCYDITTGVQERPPADVGSPVQCMDQAWGVIFVGTKSGHISRYNIKSGSIKGDRLEFSDKSVLALKASSEGPRRVLIVASRNQPITIRDALTGLFLRTICGYNRHTVYSLMRERNLVYCGTSSTSIPVFDFTNGEQVTQYNAGVGIVCMHLYRQILFAGCYDGNIYVFDTKEPKLIVSIPGPGNMLLSMEVIGDEIIAGSKNRQLHSWRMPKQVRALLSERT